MIEKDIEFMKKEELVFLILKETKKRQIDDITDFEEFKIDLENLDREALTSVAIQLDGWK